jgi:hypothetical protein
MRYLMLAVATMWRVRGISWYGLGPLSGVLFGVTMAAAYGLFRLGMGRIVALAMTLALAVSTLQLRNAPHLRDFGKAPFALLSLLLIGCLVTTQVRPRNVALIALAAGVVLGIGYGFRGDLLIFAPLFLIVLFGCLDGGLHKHLALKAAAAAMFLATFAAVAWPVLSAIARRGGCEWHVVLLGFASQFDDDLHVAPGPYAVSYRYLDGFAYSAVASYLVREQPDAPRIQLCSAAYDAASRKYFFEIVRTLPGDVLTRAYASVRGAFQLAFRWTAAPLPGWFPELYAARRSVLRALAPLAPGAIVLALIAVAFRQPRWAVAMCLMALYAGGYPSLQSDERHYFHLEFMTWWAFGLLISGAAVLAAAIWTGGVRASLASLAPGGWIAARRVIVLAASFVLVLLLPLLVFRSIQQRELRALFHSYLDAPKWPIALPEGEPSSVREIAIRSTPGQPSSWPFGESALLELDLDTSECTAPFDVPLVYDKDPSALDFYWTIPVTDDQRGLTRVFFPAYQHFRGVRTPFARGSCRPTLFQIADVRPFRLLMVAVLNPGWEERPLYQRIAPTPGR